VRDGESRGYRFLEHTTDAEIEASGKTIDGAFENAGRAVEDLMVDIESVKPREKKEIRVEARDLESLLYQWIESLIAFQDTDGLLFSQFTCHISRNSGNSYNLLGELMGEKFDPKRHEEKTAIKAPTFHDMKIIERKDGVTMRFVVDL